MGHLRFDKKFSNITHIKPRVQPEDLSHVNTRASVYTVSDQVAEGLCDIKIVSTKCWKSSYHYVIPMFQNFKDYIISLADLHRALQPIDRLRNKLGFVIIVPSV